MNLETATIFFLSGTAAVVGNILLKAGINGLGGFSLSLSELVPTILKMVGNWQIVVGFFLYGLSSFLYLKLLTSQEVTRIYPLLVAYMFIVLLLLGALFLKESVTLTKLAGVAVIILGIFLAGK